MTVFLEAIVPGPWWHPLTFESERPAERGARLSVSVAGKSRIGFATGATSDSPPQGNFKIRKVKDIIDSTPPLGWELFETALRVGRHFLCGPGEALKVIAPAHILSGVPQGELPKMAAPGSALSETHCFLPFLGDRVEEYRRLLLSQKGGSLVLFPDREGASSFWKGLPEELKKDGVLWTSNSGPGARKRWDRVRMGDFRLVVGSPSAVFAPLVSLQTVIIEDEGSPSYYSERFPFFNARSVAGSRARLWKGAVVYGGSIPSARSYLKGLSQPDPPQSEKYLFISMRDARNMAVTGVKDPLPVSDAILNRTLEVVRDKGTTIWVLDRKGYSSGVACGECGRPLTCGSCGLPLRWDDDRGIFRCGFCGEEKPVTDLCPFCGRRSLQGSRPGLEGAKIVAETMLGGDLPVHLWHADVPRAASSRKRMVEDLAGGGIVVGSRKSLELCDYLSVPLVCWLDADSLASAPFFDSSARAFRAVWESAWRGWGHPGRKVLIQSRRPRTGWQVGLVAGWDHFWSKELEERKKLDLPPWKYLVQITNLAGNKERIKAVLLEKGYETLDPGGPVDMVWLKCGELDGLRGTLAPFFQISGSPRGFPRISLRSE
ncbi:MAG: hypothetical protein WBJ42_06935 [Thermovirgaceae bacterium]|nr:hypothetical protein [Synergistales bacterium]HPC76112.1 hypothetical protein [Synergistales bacterium]HRS48789.1 hypothetical protein [Thermovirgaceae bacterium]HRU90993.1 hypothetical protein [Thermovirgaceae bacterium]